MESNEINKENVNEVINSGNLSNFSSEFIKNKKHLILDGNERIIFRNDGSSIYRLTFSCRFLFPIDISILIKHFSDKWMLSTGVLEDRNFIRINILN